MKTNKVIKELENMNLQTEVRNDYLFVTDSCGEAVGSVNLKAKFEIYIDFRDPRNKLSEDEREKIYVLLTKLAETDPQDREEEKKYCLKHKWLRLGEDVEFYLNINSDIDYFLSRIKETDFKTQFTLEEIDDIKRKFNTNLEDFELIEVME